MYISTRSENHEHEDICFVFFDKESSKLLVPRETEELYRASAFSEVSDLGKTGWQTLANPKLDVFRFSLGIL